MTTPVVVDHRNSELVGELRGLLREFQGGSDKVSSDIVGRLLEAGHVRGQDVFTKYVRDCTGCGVLTLMNTILTTLRRVQGLPSYPKH